MGRRRYTQYHRYTILTILLSLFLSIQSAYNQDIIVTLKDDSLNCKILSVRNSQIHFLIKTDNYYNLNTLPFGHIKYYQRGFFHISEIPDEVVQKYLKKHEKIKIGAYGGLSYLTAKISDNIPSEFHEYTNQLKSGYHYGGDLSFFISKNIGFGAKYVVFKSQNQMNIYRRDTITSLLELGKLKDEITITFFGPSLSARSNSQNNKTFFFCNYALGYLSYHNNATFFQDFIITSSTLGMALDLGVEMFVEDNLYFLISTSSILGFLSYLHYNNGKTKQVIVLKKNEIENISRMDFSVGLRFAF